MGRSHFTSEPIFNATVVASANIKCGSGGARTITGFDKLQGDDVVTGTVTATHAIINTGGYIKLGSHQYIFFGSAANQSAVEAAATAVKYLRILIERLVKNSLNCWKALRAYLTTTYLVKESVNV